VVDKKHLDNALKIIVERRLGIEMAREVLTKTAASAIAASAPPQEQKSATYALTELFAAFGRSTGTIEVTFEVSGRTETRQGTIFVVTQDGYALTAAHLFPDAGENSRSLVTVSVGSRNGIKQTATIIYIDRVLDVSLIKLPSSDNVPVKLVSEPLQTGEAVTVLGFPLGLPLTASAGVIASTNGPRGQLLFTTALQPGFSGSPIFDSHGNVIGLALGSTPSQSIGLPIEFVRPLLRMAGVQMVTEPRGSSDKTAAKEILESAGRSQRPTRLECFNGLGNCPAEEPPEPVCVKGLGNCGDKK
jgi:S1-C subfamily serine protease